MQPNLTRFIVALTYGVITLAHEFFMSDVNSFSYYTSAAIFDLIAMTIMSLIKPVTLITLRLNLICVISVVINFCGWALYYFYCSPITYDIAFVVVYAVVIYLLLSRDKGHVDDISLDRRGISFYFGFNSMFNNIRKNKDRS